MVTIEQPERRWRVLSAVGRAVIDGKDNHSSRTEDVVQQPLPIGVDALPALVAFFGGELICLFPSPAQSTMKERPLAKLVRIPVYKPLAGCRKRLYNRVELRPSPCNPGVLSLWQIPELSCATCPPRRDVCSFDIEM